MTTKKPKTDESIIVTEGNVDGVIGDTIAKMAKVGDNGEIKAGEIKKVAMPATVEVKRKKRKLSYNAVLKAIEGSGGMVTTIAKRFGVAWSTARAFIDLYPSLQRALLDEEEVILDVGENNVKKMVADGDWGATTFLLKTKGRKRGWYEKHETEDTTNRAEMDALRAELKELSGFDYDIIHPDKKETE